MNEQSPESEATQGAEPCRCPALRSVGGSQAVSFSGGLTRTHWHSQGSAAARPAADQTAPHPRLIPSPRPHRVLLMRRWGTLLRVCCYMSDLQRFGWVGAAHGDANIQVIVPGFLIGRKPSISNSSSG